MTHELKEALRKQALEEGFQVAAFAPVAPPPHHDHLQTWLDQGCHGSMSWMTRNRQKREDPRQLMENLGTILVLGTNYKPPDDPLAGLADPSCGIISAYARNRDYHDRIKKRVRRLARWIETQTGQTIQGRIFVDTAPVLEKPLAAAAGLGWQGKNTLLVNRQYGCWLFLAELFLSITLPPDPPTPDHCGTCTRCIDACPTKALTPYQLDASKCLAYLSIEHQGAIPEEFHKPMKNRLYGCDDCLVACPFNRFGPTTENPDFLPRKELINPPLEQLQQLDDEQFRERFRQSPVKRIGLERFRRNLAICIENRSE
ncbi:MAG: tRNA epoxyqueuosine(34) reductase QueG [Magnetococcales bacterium]|nr:tRNA epoxyqueuosine(34) reductase QueG [Magnetococcales bacterium]